MREGQPGGLARVERCLRPTIFKEAIFLIRFVVFSGNRVGSHFLQSLLNSHPKINCYWEIFWENEKILLGHDALVKTFLENHFRKEKDVDATGFLLKSWQTRLAPSILAWIKDNEVKIVHLIRGNPLNHEVALQLRRSGVVTSHSRTAVDYHQVHLDTKGLERKLRENKRVIERHRRKLKGCVVLEVKYEELLTNQATEVDRILSFLNVECSSELESEFYKTESEKPKEMIANYDEVKEVLEGTEFEVYL